MGDFSKNERNVIFSRFWEIWAGFKPLQSKIVFLYFAAGILIFWRMKILGIIDNLSNLEPLFPIGNAKMSS